MAYFFDRILKVLQDQNPPNPRTDWENLGTLAMFHKRYELGDKDHGLHFSGWEEMNDHSGITIRTKPFSCSWDSGQIGFIFMSKAKTRAEGESALKWNEAAAKAA